MTAISKSDKQATASARAVVKSLPATRKKKAANKTPSEKGRKKPFPDHLAPGAEEIREVVCGLEKLHGRPRRPTVSDVEAVRAACGETPSVLRALVATILSQNTTNKNSSSAMRSLMATFDGSWEAIHEARHEDVAASIRSGGLANVKAGRIQNILKQVRATQGTFSLDHLHELPDEQARQVMLAYDGVGEKTAACVLLFCLRRESFAVDTHVFRIAKRLGWVPQKATRDQTYAHLEPKIPNALKYRLHVLFVEHGKCCINCAANHRPQRVPLGPCPLDAIVARI